MNFGINNHSSGVCRNLVSSRMLSSFSYRLNNDIWLEKIKGSKTFLNLVIFEIPYFSENGRIGV